MSLTIRERLKVIGICILYFCGGFYICHLFMGPKDIPFDGKQFKISNAYTANIWFHESGSIRELTITSVSTNKGACHAMFYPNGVTKQFMRRLPSGIESNVYYEDGTMRLKSLNDTNDRAIRTEYYTKDGVLERIEEK